MGDWFQRIVECILQKLPEDGYAIFIQTDVKVSADCTSRRGTAGGYWQWVSKAHLVMTAAARVEKVRLLWHRIIVSGSWDKTGWHNTVAGYSHCLCFRKS